MCECEHRPTDSKVPPADQYVGGRGRRRLNEKAPKCFAPPAATADAKERENLWRQ